ncbi:MAG: elongation factor G [Pirellulaceae bacterium]|nr:elongation factor G [Pirellulaceae bacterium]
MARELQKIRNIGIIAHIDAGKTTVTERMLYVSGAKHKAGGVDQGTTETDDDPEEQERGITIYAACVTFKWKEIIVNLLDTPGHVDFTAEVERCLRVLDGAVVVFSGREGVEAQSETVWRQADRYQVPRIVFINKLDREGADFYRVLDEIKLRLGANPVAVQIPIGMGPAHVATPFAGCIDLIDMQALRFPKDEDGRNVKIEPIPDDLMDDALAWREAMLEPLYSLNSQLMELALEEKPIPAELIRQTLRQGCLDRSLQPVVCGSALHGIGVQAVLDAVGSYLPCPLDRPPVTGIDPHKPDKQLTRKPSVDEPFCGLVFKILPAKTGDMYWLRVYSGKLEANSRVYCPNRDKKENVAQLWQLHATKKDRQGQVQVLECGDIACAIGPRYGITGDTFCDTREMIQLPSIQFAQAVLSMAIEPENTTERKKLAEVLEMLKRQDPTFHAAENAESGQTLISGMGELHLDVIKHRLTRDFNLNVKFYKPRVNYRETIAKSAEVQGQCNRQIGDKQMFARVTLRMEPLDDRSAQPIVLDRLFGEAALPDALKTAVIEELRGRVQGGGLIGSFPLTGLRVTLVGGEMREVGSDEVAFRIAANDAFELGLQAGGPTLLEPLMRLEIVTPEDYVGEIVGDLQQRRAIIDSTEARGAMTCIIALAPLKELFGYSSAIRSLSQGRAGCSMEPQGYQPAPETDVEGFGFT